MMTIRPAHVGDLDAVIAIIQKAIGHMDNQGILQWDEIYPSNLILKIDIELKQMHVIENEGRVCGCITLNEEQAPEYSDVPWSYPGKALVVHRLTIDPEHQGEKLATRLMDFAEKEAASKGYNVIRLDAFTKNPAAVALYEGRDYRNAGTVLFRKGFFFCYEKKLNR